MLLKIRKIGGAFNLLKTFFSGRIMGAMLCAVKKRAKNDFPANRPYSLTITVLTVS